MSLSSLLHYVSLDGAGGVELQFAEFLTAAAALSPARHAVVACGRSVHPLVAERLAPVAASVAFEKYAWPLKLPVKLPKWPRAIRAAYQKHHVDLAQPDAVIIWNRLRDSLSTLAAAGSGRCVYWERGAAWFAGDTSAKRRFLAEVPAVLCNSVAARRMLELRWRYSGRMQVVPNALRPSLRPAQLLPRSLPAKASLRLGMVARLESIKGAALALQALVQLPARGIEAELHIAGDGPERARLHALAGRLGLEQKVFFRGLIADMGAFYQKIDVLIHPALREPFGQIAVEAGAYGVPAVVAAVDGLVEVVTHERTGLCVAPTRPLADYKDLGGGTVDLPPFVYDPLADAIGEPKLVDPVHLADAVARLANDPALYERLSRQAIADVAERFNFEQHVRRALAAIEEFVSK